MKAIETIIEGSPEQLEATLYAIIEAWRANPGYRATKLEAKVYYRPSPKLAPKLAKLKKLMRIRRPTSAERLALGQTLEAVAHLAFSSISGCDTVKSYQSAGPQIDLYVSGNSLDWFNFCRFIGIEKRSILVECKAIAGRLEDKQFSRMCDVLCTNFSSSADLAVFFTLRGASGFPAKAADKKKEPTPERVLRDCRLRQALFFARQSKAVIVFDLDDLVQLTRDGTLPILLHRKILEIELATGLPTKKASEVDLLLPKHLAKL
jgi:hypothetical protein